MDLKQLEYFRHVAELGSFTRAILNQIESIPSVIDLVRQGFGYAVLPMNAVTSTPWRDELSVQPVVGPLLTTSLSIATSAQRPRGPLIAKALDVIRDIVCREIHPLETA
jgi:LysR family nitrogen assimilation transcriptional regulator